jgi:NADPH:quinone reductase-like Zn-dependent oxidoreductase
VRDTVASVDVALDAAGKGGLSDAVALAGGPTRVITLADTNAADLGVRFSVGTPDRAPEALDVTMALLASGALQLRHQRHFPMELAAAAHRLLEKDGTHEKFILDAPSFDPVGR